MNKMKRISQFSNPKIIKQNNDKRIDREFYFASLAI